MIQEQNFILKVFKLESSNVKKSTITLNSEGKSETEEKIETDENNENKDTEEKKELDEDIEESMESLDVAILSKVHEPIKDVKIKNKI